MVDSWPSVVPGLRDHTAVRERLNAELRLSPGDCVALTIDMQRAYLDPAVATKPLPADEAAGIVAASVAFLARCRALGVPVIHAYVNRQPHELAARAAHRRFAARSAAVRAGAPDGRPAEPIGDRLDGSPQAELPSGMAAPGDVHVRSKKTIDSFYGTELDLLLGRTFKRVNVLVLGINTDTCVHAAVVGASVRGYSPVIAADCVGSHRGVDHTWMALELMSRTLAWVLPSADILAKLEG